MYIHIFCAYVYNTLHRTTTLAQVHWYDGHAAANKFLFFFLLAVLHIYKNTISKKNLTLYFCYYSYAITSNANVIYTYTYMYINTQIRRTI